MRGESVLSTRTRLPATGYSADRERRFEEIKCISAALCLPASTHYLRPLQITTVTKALGKTFKIALADGKVSSNPARLVEQRPEQNARIRFPLNEEKRQLET